MTPFLRRKLPAVPFTPEEKLSYLSIVTTVTRDPKLHEWINADVLDVQLAKEFNDFTSRFFVDLEKDPDLEVDQGYFESAEWLGFKNELYISRNFIKELLDHSWGYRKKVIQKEQKEMMRFFAQESRKISSYTSLIHSPDPYQSSKPFIFITSEEKKIGGQSVSFQTRIRDRAYIESSVVFENEPFELRLLIHYLFMRPGQITTRVILNPEFRNQVDLQLYENFKTRDINGRYIICPASYFEGEGVCRLLSDIILEREV